MWRPGFDFIDTALAWVYGYHRALCIYSHVHRGTPQCPGLVLGLDHGGSCQGVAFRVASSKREETLAYLRERELVTSVYLEKSVTLRLNDGSRKRALAYIVDRRHNQYAGPLSIENMTQLILKGAGINGDNSAYVRNTYEHLQRLNIRDAKLTKVIQDLDRNVTRNSPCFKIQKK